MLGTSLLLGVAMLGSPDATGAKITKVSMFKNGFAMVMREIPVGKVGELVLDQIPESRLGTLWFSTTKGLKVDSIVATDVPTTSRVNAATFEDMLAMNVGKEITVDLVNLPQTTGKLLKCDGTVFVIQDARGVSTIAKGELRRITIAGEVVLDREVKGTKRALRIRTSGDPGTIAMMSFESGLMWTPAYALDISDKKKLTVVAKATILNDLAPFEGIEARLVTGFPHIAYRNVMDPLVASISALGFAGQLGGAVYSDMDNSILTQNAPMGRAGGFGGGGGGRFTAAEGFTPEGIGGVQAEDLFFYRQPNVSLKKGERGYYVLFRAEAEYEHVYTWDVQDAVQGDSAYRGIPEGPGEVWHSLKFKNTSGQPFTTGTAVTMQDGEILGQDQIDYTSAGAEATVKITKALDVRAEGSEEEVSRERNKMVVPNVGPYDLVELKGTLEVENRKAEKVKLQISKNLTGDEVAADSSAKIVKTARGLRSINPRVHIEWAPVIEPGKTVRLTYRYKVFVRS